MPRGARAVNATARGSATSAKASQRTRSSTKRRAAAARRDAALASLPIAGSSPCERSVRRTAMRRAGTGQQHERKQSQCVGTQQARCGGGNRGGQQRQALRRHSLALAAIELGGLELPARPTSHGPKPRSSSSGGLACALCIRVQLLREERPRLGIGQLREQRVGLLRGQRRSGTSGSAGGAACFFSAPKARQAAASSQATRQTRKSTGAARNGSAAPATRENIRSHGSQSRAPRVLDLGPTPGG